MKTKHIPVLEIYSDLQQFDQRHLTAVAAGGSRKMWKATLFTAFAIERTPEVVVHFQWMDTKIEIDLNWDIMIDLSFSLWQFPHRAKTKVYRPGLLMEDVRYL